MEDKNLVGLSLACQEGLRSLAYTTLAELVHHIRKHLTVEQCGRVVHKFARAMHDPTFNTSVHQVRY
jgi:transformation/transcription domain-associated protein